MNLLSIETHIFDNLSKDCSFKIKRIGQEYCSPQKKPEKIKRDYYSLHFVLFGSGTLKNGDDCYKIKAGSAFLLYEGIEYEYYPDPKNPWAYLWIDLYGVHLDELFAQTGFTRSEPVIKIKDMNAFNSLLRDLHESYSHSLYGEMANYGYFFLILDRLLDNYTAFTTKNRSKILNQKLIRDILIFMNNNSALNLTPKEIGKKFNISYSTLMALFKSEVDMAPMEYLTHFRISYACIMLKSENKMSIGEISNMVGYSDQMYFARLFKKIKGMTPTEYSKSDIREDPFDWLKEKNLDFR